jgi:enolase
MAPLISSLSALEILDSRGRPTLRVFCRLSDGRSGAASVPSGASTGEREAIELRDDDPRRFHGRGVRQAVRNVNEVIGPRLAGLDPRRQADIDSLLIKLDGTPNKSRLGANALLGASMAVAQAAAAAAGVPLYAYLGGPEAARLPVPMMNVLNGGHHADNNLDFQEFMIVPHGAPSFAEALRWAAEVFEALRGQLALRRSTAVGDEGGFAPDLGGHEEACELLLDAVARAGYVTGRDVSLALDPAASTFYDGERYDLRRSGEGSVTSADLTARYADWCRRFHVVSIEDGLAETDWEGFVEQTATLGRQGVQIVGDDLYATNPRLIYQGIERRATNAALIKLNQIGTVSETIEAIGLCRAAGWQFIVSHRSGETEDTFIADFAVAMGGGQIKTGSLCRSERVAKYNRLLEIEAELGDRAVFSSPFSAPAGRGRR